jgi:Protein of unknown function (DUF2934)
MAKKTAKNPEAPTASPAAPAKRRAAAPKKASSPAAPAMDIATVGGTEPLANASDTRSSTTADTQSTAGNNGGHQPSHDEIAQAAYFRHLNRGGGEGGEFDDWVEAERELRERRR